MKLTTKKIFNFFALFDTISKSVVRALRNSDIHQSDSNRPHERALHRHEKPECLCIQLKLVLCELYDDLLVRVVDIEAHNGICEVVYDHAYNLNATQEKLEGPVARPRVNGNT